MLEQMTPEQEALYPQYREKWKKIGTSCEPLDFEVSKEAVCDMYRLVGLQPPETFLRARSPVEAARMAAQLEGTDDIKRHLSGQMRGYHDAGWLSFYDFLEEVMKVDISDMKPALVLAQNCGWWSPYDTVCILQDRHTEVHRDESFRYHNPNGPSVAFADGVQAFFWNGVAVPRAWIMDKASVDISSVLHTENAERRRAGVEIFGWDVVLNRLGAQVLDVDPNPQIGTLLEADVPGSGKEKFLRVLCGTGRQFAIPVPPETRTAREGQQWIWNDPHYNPEIRT